MTSGSLPHHHRHLHLVTHVTIGDQKCLLSTESFRVSHVRRALDLVVAGTLLVMTSPILLVAAVAVLVTSGWPVFSRQTKIGEAGRPFTLWRIRTTRKDGTVTGVGMILGRTSLDGLPLLWHVLRGQMTLVGPRPESPERAAGYPTSCQVMLAARPGITGPSQVAFARHSAVPPAGWDAETWYLEVLVPLRADVDLGYLIEPTLWRTLRLVWVGGLSALGLVDRHRAVAIPRIPTQRIADPASLALPQQMPH
jgi:lipopolysaccharide/colanic/teichoic acid biosynthesis glycosyltransferase